MKKLFICLLITCALSISATDFMWGLNAGRVEPAGAFSPQTRLWMERHSVSLLDLHFYFPDVQIGVITSPLRLYTADMEGEYNGAMSFFPFELYYDLLYSELFSVALYGRGEMIYDNDTLMPTHEYGYFEAGLRFSLFFKPGEGSWFYPCMNGVSIGYNIDRQLVIKGDLDIGALFVLWLISEANDNDDSYDY